MKPATLWYKGLAKDHKDSFNKALLNNTSNVVLKRLIALVDEQIANLDKNLLVNYENPNWSHLQADHNGQKRGLRFVKDLLRHMEG